MIDNYRSGRYPRHERLSDEFFKTQGSLMEAFAAIGELQEQVAEGLRREQREAEKTIAHSRAGMQQLLKGTKRGISDLYETILQKMDRYL